MRKASPLPAAFVFHPDLSRLPSKAVAGEAVAGNRPAELALEEICNLTRAINLAIAGAEIIKIGVPKPATFFGGGIVSQFKSAFDASEAPPDLVIVNGSLSPVQHRNLEKAWHIKILDRTALILEIFGARARTREGKLQVALAHLTYQRSRLVRSWTHLERQRGGAGFLGGPGERQIESDRRILAGKIQTLRGQLDQVRRTRNLQRAQRKKAPYPVIALVGYTNAGKSTLFNYLTSANVLAQDMLFATLDPTMRALDLPGRTKIILSDTVGFIADLPAQLVAAFRATLEEVKEADIILHVRDISHPETQAQRLDVIRVLEELGIERGDPRPVMEVWNKADLLDEEQRASYAATAEARKITRNGDLLDPVSVLLSARSGDGISDLLDLIDKTICRDHRIFKVTIPLTDGRIWAWLHQHGVQQVDPDDDAGHPTGQPENHPPCDAPSHDTVYFRLSAKSAGQFRKLFPHPLIACGP